jgi:hypothetical protein
MTLRLKNQTAYDPSKAGEQIRTLYASSKGIAGLRKVVRDATRISKELEESFAVDPRQLDLPVTY